LKLECTRKELLEALAFAGSATSTRSALPILKTVRLDADGTSLGLLGCDGELWAERKIEAIVATAGAACVDFSLLRDIIGKLPDGQLTLELDGANVFLRHGGSEWRMMALPADEFPQVPSVEGSSELRMPIGELRAAVDAVAHAVADDNSRPVLTGVQFAYDGNTLILAATDMQRLAVTKLEQPGIGSPLSAIVPERALRAIKSLPLDDSKEVVVRFDDSRLHVEVGGTQVVAQLLMGTFPNWERVVPAESTRSWTFDRTELLDNVNRAMILARDNANRVRFRGNPDSVLISARSEERGEAKEEVAVVAKNGDVEIVFNGRYVEDALKSIKGDGVLIELTEPSRPALFKAVDADSPQYCVIAPMSLG